MGVHRVGAVMIGPGARAAADGFVVLVGIVAEDEVVHGALGRCQQAERRIERVGNALGDFCVTRNHRRGINRCQDGPFKAFDVDGFQAAFVQRNFVVDKGSEDIQNGCLTDCRRRVEVAGVLR